MLFMRDKLVCIYGTIPYVFGDDFFGGFREIKVEEIVEKRHGCLACSFVCFETKTKMKIKNERERWEERQRGFDWWLSA